MNISIIDNLIVLSYLILTLTVGLYFSRNIKSIRDYAIGNYKFSTVFLVATICATWLDGGSTIGISEKVYKYGIVYTIIFFAESLKMLSVIFIAPRMEKFHGMLSVSEIMGNLYGIQGRIITGIAATLFSLGIVGAQINAIGYMFNEFLGIETISGIFIGCSIVIIYSVFGGIKAVAITDVIQFGFFVIAVPIICSIALDKVGGYSELLLKLPDEHFKIFPSYGKPVEFIFIFLLFCIPFLDPALVQRILMAKDKHQIALSFKITALIIIPFYLLGSTTALATLIINPGLEPAASLPFIIKNFLPVGVKGLAIAGMLAVVMSSADSFLNTSGIAVVHDLINPLRVNKLTPKQELNITKIVTLIIGVCSVFVATKFNSVVDIVMKFQNVWGPVVVVPLIAGIYGYQSNAKSFIWSVANGLLVVLIWMIFDLEAKLAFDSVIPGLAVNGLTFFICSEISKKSYLQTI